jgi:hypothetical protein
MLIEVDHEDVQTCSTDGRGRGYLGTEYADKDELVVAVIEDRDATDADTGDTDD